MTVEDISEEDIFRNAIGFEDRDEQADFVKRACGDDTELCAAVEALLRHHYQSSILDAPALESTLLHDTTPITESPGTVIGRYKLLEKIGEGGMAVVYMAEQEKPIRRKVALKIIKLGMDTKQVIARFEAERQALAMMDHPSIAKVLDAGATETGRPYFVMELVKGISITEYCDKNKLSTQERLNLFIQACHAIQHAHQKGIIHRDIKPTNVMVTLHDDKAVPKVIDFGIAKAINQRLTEKTVFTRYAQMIGTPAYMSPEQARLSGLDIDTRTDIYSLGVLLYELLTGTTPFDTEKHREAGYVEIQRIIREEEPDKPSTKLSTMGEALTEVAKHHKTNPDLLTKLVRGDLDWIVMKSLEKDRTRRYATAAEVATDIERHLKSEPVLAGAPTVSYKLRKFLRRHHVGVTAGSLVAAALVVGLVVSTAMYFQVEEALEKEATAHRQSERTLYFNRINLAEKYYLESNIGRARSLLVACPGDLRGWEWHYLWHRSDQARITLQGHKGPVYSVAFSPDGRRIVSGSEDNTLKIWDTDNRADVITLRGHTKEVRSVAFSPDSRRIVSGSDDSTIKVWDAESGSELMTLQGHENPVLVVAYSPNGKRIVSGSFSRILRIPVTVAGRSYTVVGYAQEMRTGEQRSYRRPNDEPTSSGSGEGALKVWDAENGSEVMTLQGNVAVKSVAFSPDGRWIVSGRGDDTLKVWDVKSGSEMMTLSWHEGYVNSVAFGPNGKRIAAGSSNKTVKLWDVKSGSEMMTFRGHAKDVRSVAFSPDGSQIVSGSFDNTVKVWDAENGRELMTLRGHEGGVESVSFRPEGGQIVSSSRDNTVKVWDVENDSGVRTLKGHKAEVHSVAFSPDGGRIVSSSFDNTLKIWDTNSGREVMTLRGYGRYVRRVAFSPDGRRIVSGSSEKTLKVWDADNGSEVMTLRGHEGPVESVVFSPDGRRIVSGSQDKTIKVWGTESGNEMMTLQGHVSRVWSVALSPDGRRIVSGSADKTLKVWDATSGSEMMTLRGHEGRVWSVAFSPDGRQIISGSSDKTLKVWDVESGGQVMTLRGHAEDVLSVAYSPDGRRIVSGGRDNTLKVWDAESGHELMTLRGHKNRVTSVAFSPDGRRIVSGSFDRAIKIWGMPDSGEAAAEPPAGDKGLYQALQVSKRSPANASDVGPAPSVELLWVPALEAAAQRVYFGPDPNSLALLKEVLSGSAVNSPTLQKQLWYWWRVDTVRSDGSVVEGELWSFSTGGLVAWWQFDETEGRTATDSSGRGHHGSLIGNPHWQPGRIAGALAFDGQDGYVSIKDAPDFDMNREITVACWVNIANFDIPWQAIIAKGNRSWRIIRAHDGGNIEFACTGLNVQNTNWGNVIGRSVVDDGQWHHLAGVYDGMRVCLYVDGVLDGSVEGTGSINSNDDYVLIGANAGDAWRYWHGLIDDVRIYSYALSPEDIKALHEGKEPSSDKGSTK